MISNAFIPFIMGAHPNMEVSIEAVMALSGLGAGAIEIGVPFSDPVADGPVNQRAAEIALENGASLSGILEMVSRLRAKGCKTPLVLFSYLNPLFAMGFEHFAVRAKAAGVDAVLIVDLPPEESGYYEILKQAGLGIVLLASPTTDPARFGLYKGLSPAFVYYISRLGVTGVQKQLPGSLEQEVGGLRAALPGIPIAVGFGISTPEQAAQVAKFADGVVVGSALVKTLESGGLTEFGALARSIVDAIHRA